MLSLALVGSLVAGNSYAQSEENMDKQSEQTGAAEVVLINPFEVPADKLDESIAFWEVCRDFLQTQPGYISTKLHQSLKDDATFELINVAVWASAQDFMAASENMKQYLKEQGVRPVEGLKFTPALYKLICE